MADFRITYHGTVTLLHPLTPACREWIDENVATEGWQWFGGGIAVEPRYLDNLVSGMAEAGLQQEDE